VRLATVARYAIAVVAAGYLLAYLAIGPVRVLHPFEIEWIEGAMLDNVQRILSGEKIYVAPSLDFVSTIYPPVFYYASAAVAAVTGGEFVALRLVSFLSIVGAFALLFRFVARETDDRFAALIATGLFAATFKIGGAWFDVGRVDSLFLVILTAAMYVLRFHQTLRGHVAGGVLIALAFMTKQSGVVMAAPMLLYVCYRNWRYGLVAGSVATVLMAGGALLVDALHDGWFLFYTFRLPQTYHVSAQRLVAFWRVDIIPPVAVAWAIGLYYFAAARDDSPRLFYAALVAGLLGGSWVSRGNLGAYANVLIPCFFLASLLFGLGVGTARRAVAASDERARNGWDLWIAGAALLQFALLAYNPLAHLPRRGDAAAGRQFVQSLAAVQGDVWVPYQGHLATMAGKRQYAHWMAINDILDSGIDSIRVPLQAQIDSAIASRRFALIVLSNAPFVNSPDLKATYDSIGVAVPDADAFWPLTGARRRPLTRWTPKPAPAPDRE
jgi:4-amino-4-deoxy-L-arabinose transferase-like glycosyltransferase